MRHQFIRDAAPTDAHALASVQVASWQRAYCGIIPTAYLEGYTVEMRHEAWTRNLGVPTEGISTFVWESPRGIEGFVSLRCLPGAGELLALYAHPDAWGTGVGHALHAHAIHILNAHDYTHAELWVLADNARAARFYSAHGWLRSDQSKAQDYGGEAIELHRYTRALSED